MRIKIPNTKILEWLTFLIFKINERSNVERPNLRVTTMKNKNLENEEIYLHQRANMRTGKIASGTKYRMDEQFKNLLIFVIFQVLIILEICQFKNL